MGNKITKFFISLFGAEAYAEAYSLHYKNKGHALIIIMTKNQPGWEIDVQNMRNIFDTLDIPVDSYQDLSLEELSTVVSQFASSAKHRDGASAWVVLFGESTSQNGASSIRTNDGHFVVNSEFQQIFCENMSKYLRGKPKLFLVHACKEQTAFHSHRPKDNTEAGPDFLICSSLASQHEGNYFISELTEAFEKNATDKDIVDILNDVNRQLLNHRPDYQVSFSSGLTRKFFLYSQFPWKRVFAVVTVTGLCLAAGIAGYFGWKHREKLLEISNLKQLLTKTEQEAEEKLTEAKQKLEEVQSKADSAGWWAKVQAPVTAVATTYGIYCLALILL